MFEILNRAFPFVNYKYLDNVKLDSVCLAITNEGE